MRQIVLIPVIATLLAACGGDDPPEFADVAPDAAEQALITRDSLPPGWREESGSPLDGVELSSGCDILTPEGAFPDAAAIASSPSFTTVDRRSAQSFSAVFESEERARGAVGVVEATVDRCHDEFLDEVGDAAEAELKGEGVDLGPFADIDVGIDRGTPPDAGDQALLYEVRVRVSVLGVEREFNADIALVRDGRVVGVLLYSSYSHLDEAEEGAFLKLMADRLAEAEGTLP